MLKIAYSSAITLAAMLKTRSARRLARCLLLANLCAHIFIKRETSGYEAERARFCMVFHLNFCPTRVLSLLAYWSSFIVIFQSILRSFRNTTVKFAQLFINKKLEPVL